MYSYNEKTGEFEVVSSRSSFSFSSEELQAVSRVAVIMLKADGVTKDIETATLLRELGRFAPEGINRIAAIIRLGALMEEKKCYQVIKAMNSNQKYYISCLLVTLMVVDQDVAESEKIALAILITLCGLPVVSISDALQYMVDLQK